MNIIIELKDGVPSAVYTSNEVYKNYTGHSYHLTLTQKVKPIL
jgi:hypothetical protein